MDTQAPGKPTLYTPENNATVATATPTFGWENITDSSGVTYQLVIDNDLDFLAPIYDKSGIPENQHLVENSLSADNYYWRVKAVDGAGWQGSWADWYKVIVAPMGPQLVSPVDGTTLSDNTPFFQWIPDTTNDDAITIKIDNDADMSPPLYENNLGTGHPENHQLPDENKLSDGLYYWQIVEAIDGYSSIWSFTIDTQAPPVPTGLSVVDEAGAEGSLVISWNAVGGDVQGYQLWFSSDGTNYTLESDQSGTTYTDTGLTDGQTYWYKVSAYDEVPNYSDNCTALSGTPLDDLTPSVPTGLAVVDEAGAEGSLVISWNAVGGDVQGYQLWFSSDGTNYTLESDQSGTTYTDTGLTDGQTYWYKVSAYDEVPNYSDNCTALSETPLDDLAPSVPTGLTVTNVGTGENLDPSWTAPPELDLAGYKLYRSTISGGPYSLIATVGVITSYRDNGLTTGTTYYYVISAFDEIPNYSDNCTEVSGTPTVGVPSSSVNDIILYWQTTTPFTLTATASIIADNLTPYYRYSSDNDNWGTWTSFDVDTASPWEWSFTADNGDGYYEFYSIAVGSGGQESPPVEADARCGVDTVAPIITSVLINGGDDLTPSTSVTLTIDATDATSGLAEMQFSDDNESWSEWEPFDNSKSYALPEGDGLKTVYIRVSDEAGLESTIASDSITLETVPPPPEGAVTEPIRGIITAGSTGSADFTRYAIAVTKIRVTAADTVSDVRVDVVVHTARPAGVTAVALPVFSYLDITTSAGATKISGATIEFKAPRSWISGTNIDERKVKLLRFRGSWQELPTRYLGADASHHHYEASSLGFSLFAIAGERRAAPPVVAPPPTAPTTLPAPLPATSAAPLEFFAMLSIAGAIGGFAAAYSLLARPSRYYLILKQLKRAVIGSGWRFIGKPLPRPPVMVRKRVSRTMLAALRRLERIIRERRRKFTREAEGINGEEKGEISEAPAADRTEDPGAADRTEDPGAADNPAIELVREPRDTPRHTRP